MQIPLPFHIPPLSLFLSLVVFRFHPPFPPPHLVLPYQMMIATDFPGSIVQTFQLSSIFAIRKYGQSRQSVARLRISRGELSWKFDETIKVRVESARTNLSVCVCVYTSDREIRLSVMVANFQGDEKKKMDVVIHAD